MDESSKYARLLIVEDNEGDVLLIKEALDESDILDHLHTVGDGVEALAFLRRETDYRDAARPDVILLDLNLPRMDGREVLREIKSDDRLRRIPVVVFTSSTESSDIVISYDLHANCYISKPVRFEEYAKVVKTIEEFWLSVVTLPPE